MRSEAKSAEFSGASDPSPKGGGMPVGGRGGRSFQAVVCSLWTVVFTVACGGGDEGCPTGSEGCPCTGGGSCDAPLTCLSNLCVNPTPEADGNGLDNPQDGGQEAADPSFLRVSYTCEGISGELYFDNTPEEQGGMCELDSVYHTYHCVVCIFGGGVQALVIGGRYPTHVQGCFSEKEQCFRISTHDGSILNDYVDPGMYDLTWLSLFDPASSCAFGDSAEEGALEGTVTVEAPDSAGFQSLTFEAIGRRYMQGVVVTVSGTAYCQ